LKARWISILLASKDLYLQPKNWRAGDATAPQIIHVTKYPITDRPVTAYLRRLGGECLIILENNGGSDILFIIYFQILKKYLSSFYTPY